MFFTKNLHLKTWFQSRPLWLKGGILGVIICIALFLFYGFIYFPIIDTFSTADKDSFVAPLVITGHYIPLISSLFLEGSNIMNFFCEPTVKICVESSIEFGCLREDIIPKGACVERVIQYGFWSASFLFIVFYFILGSIVGYWIQKKKHID